MAQLNYRIGDVESNAKKMLKAIDKAKASQAELIVFSELSLTGYPPKDLLDYDSFIDHCEKLKEQLIQASRGIAIVFGAPHPNTSNKGKKLYNSALVATEGKLEYVVNKTLLPNYDIFNESRFFEENRSFSCIYISGRKVALTICEDLWNIGSQKIYRQTPMDELAKENPDFILNISASPYNYNQMEERETIMKENAKKYNLPVIYVNQVGAQTDIIFDGGSLFLNKKGEVLQRCDFFKESLEIIETKHQKPEQKILSKKNGDISQIYQALLLGLKDYFEKLNFKKAIFGSSGGIDSAVTAALATKVLGKENISAVLMPSKFSSKSSLTDAHQLTKNLGIHQYILPIQETVNTFERTLEDTFNGLQRDVTEENLQARTRGVLLMAMSNKFGYILLNTSNKSESAVGYTTLYGDMSGGLSVIGDLYKTQVYELAHYLNRDEEIIPKNILQKEPSAELKPNQKDTDSLPDYNLLDKILFHYIEGQKGWEQIVEMGFEKSLVRRVIQMVDHNVYKRFQAPPTLRISSKAFGVGRQMPIVGKYRF